MNDAAVAFVVWIDGHFVLEEFVGIDALELALGERLVTFETVAKGSRKGIARDLPEFSNLDARRVELQGSTH